MIIEIKKLPFIKITEVAKMMGLSESYTYTLAKMPSCPFVCKKIGKRVVVHTKSFVDWYLKVSDVDEEDADKYLVDDKLFFTAVEIAKLLKVKAILRVTREQSPCRKTFKCLDRHIQ